MSKRKTIVFDDKLFQSINTYMKERGIKSFSKAVKQMCRTNLDPATTIIHTSIKEKNKDLFQHGIKLVQD